MIEQIKMPPRSDGTYPPIRYRWLCDYGHIHPGRNHAVKCHERQRRKAALKAQKAPR